MLLHAASPSNNGPLLRRTTAILLGLLLAATVFRVGAAFWTAGQTELTVWGDRDLWRALAIGREFLGPEINGGMRPPGGAFYLLLSAILSIHPSVLAAHVGVLALFFASLVTLGIVIAREISPRAGILAAAILAGSPMLADVLKVWNPGYVLFFATLATLFGILYLRTGRAFALGLATAAIAIGLQIHLQIFQLMIGLGLAAIIRRPPWTKRHALAMLIGGAIPYLPTVMAGGTHLLALTAPVPAGAVDNYLLWEFDPLEKAQLIYGLLGGTPGSIAVGADGRPTALAFLPIAGDLVAALLAFGFLIWAGRGHLSDARARPTGAFALIAGVFFLEGLVSSVNARHLVAAMPAVAAMAGIAADQVLTRLATFRRRPVAAIGSGVLLLLLALRPVALGCSDLSPPDFSAGSVQMQAEIAATAKAVFYPDHEDFESHAALFWRGGPRNWQLAQEGVAGQMAFVYRTTSAPLATGERDDCLAIVRKDEMSGDVRAELARLSAFSGLAPVFGQKAAESTHFAFFPYTTADGNCLKSFPNAYVPTRFETRYLTPGENPTAQRTSDGAAFVASLPGQTYPIGVELRRTGDSFQAILHGRLLRGYTGLHFATIVGPVLCAADDDGVQMVPLGRSTVGSPQRGTLAPWRSPRFLLAAGTHRFWLIGRDGKSPRAIELPLGQITLPDATVAPPDLSTPPAGCASPVAAQPNSPG
ncbi:hypothetical protein [Telmatospirillum sp.]|uniref:hypothetical protein n=1 Tax=Telmatospirillum sp. TaxID=2079197 RepID=UPI00283E42F9|nr:hypothetical protein [Telmatospirillum sp.]MDR3437107.1 hypothetical protein [Telmatospirillum sp.]